MLQKELANRLKARYDTKDYPKFFLSKPIRHHVNDTEPVLKCETSGFHNEIYDLTALPTQAIS